MASRDASARVHGAVPAAQDSVTRGVRSQVSRVPEQLVYPPPVSTLLRVEHEAAREVAAEAAAEAAVEAAGEAASEAASDEQLEQRG